MDWYSLDVNATTGPDWLAIDPALRGHWHALIAVCAQRENSGVLRGAQAWGDRNWDRLAGLTGADLDALEREHLVRWDGDDLVVIGYDVEREQKAQATRARQRATAEARWEKERQKSAAAADAMADAAADPMAVPAAMQKRQDKKRQEEKRQEPLAELAEFARLFRARKGVDYRADKKARDALAKLVVDVGAVEVCRRMGLYFSEDWWFTRDGSYSVSGFVRNWNDCAAPPAPPARAPRAGSTSGRGLSAADLFAMAAKESA